MKRRVEKKPPVTEAAFEAMLEQQDDVSAWVGGGVEGVGVMGRGVGGCACVCVGGGGGQHWPQHFVIARHVDQRIKDSPGITGVPVLRVPIDGRD